MAPPSEAHLYHDDNLDDLDEEDLVTNPSAALSLSGITCCAPYTSFVRPVDLSTHQDFSESSSFTTNGFYIAPVFGPLLFNNETSDCRDHCANERTFLSYLRLSIYMAIVSVAIVLSFHLRKTASELELRLAMPLGGIFWALSVCCLGVGFANYIKTVNKYSRRKAIVQSGWKTQTVMGVTALSIAGACLSLLVINKLNEGADE